MQIHQQKKNKNQNWPVVSTHLKNISQNWMISPNRGEHKKCLKPPSRKATLMPLPEKLPIETPHVTHKTPSGEGFTPTQSQLGNVLRHCGTPLWNRWRFQWIRRCRHFTGWEEQAPFLITMLFLIYFQYIF